VTLAWIGRPLDLYEAIGLPVPTETEVALADRDDDTAPWITSACGVFDVMPRPEHGHLFLDDHLVFHLRIDVAARDIDTVSYETTLRVRPDWAGRSEPTTHEDRNAREVDINVRWTPLIARKPT
jgi:hypothetical protein